MARILHTGIGARFMPKQSSHNSHSAIYENQNFGGAVKRNQKPKTRRTIFFSSPPLIKAGGSVVGEKESEGPIGGYFDKVVDAKGGKKKESFEFLEKEMLEDAIEIAIKKARLSPKQIDMLLCGDLLNQMTSSSYAARELGIAYMGLYSACSTMSQALAVGAAFLNAGYFKTVACATVSHFATAERQFRYPLEYGAQRPPYAQWTVTGAGCSILTNEKGKGNRITSATFGKVVDYGIDDLNNMGAAMAPAALDTLITLFVDTGLRPEDFDLIVTGDLGKLGSDILRDLAEEQGYRLGQNYTDCGQLIYDYSQKIYQGGSGCGCSASVLNSYLLAKMDGGYYNRIAFLATGALMSPQSCFQGGTIPCVSHGVVIERG